MKAKFTLKDLEQKLKEGKIKSFHHNTREKMIGYMKESIQAGRIVTKHFSKASPAKDYISRNLLEWSQHIPTQLQEEYIFHPVRKWRFDWALTEMKIAIEFEGGIFIPGAKSHKHSSGVARDIEKYNAAQELGWKVLRFHSKNYETLITQIEILYQQWKNQKRDSWPSFNA